VDCVNVLERPGAMERMFGQAGGVSLGGLMAGSLLSSIAGTVIGSMIARVQIMRLMTATALIPAVSTKRSAVVASAFDPFVSANRHMRYRTDSDAVQMYP
jgi:predicted lipid-binding transport protein (Tim44 family)